jgi:type II secretory pathway component PulM
MVSTVMLLRINDSGLRTNSMFRRLKELYQQYKPYVRVDLVMYGVLLLLIVLYFIYSLIVG